MRWLHTIEKRLGRVNWPRFGSSKWNPQSTWKGVQRLLAGVLVVAVVVGWTPARQYLSTYVNAKRALSINPDRVVFEDAPGWMPAGFKKNMQRIVASQISAHPLDSKGLSNAVAALTNSGWARKVDSISRLDGQVRVKAEFRQPCAFVRQEEGYRMIDTQGVMLPGLYQAKHLAMLSVPVIKGVNQISTSHGQIWPGKQVPAVLSLLRELADQPYYRQIRGIEVRQEESQDRLRLVLLTYTGQVLWGLPPGQERMIEPATATKKAWLMQVCRQSRGAIDAGGKIVEVNGPAVFVRDLPPTSTVSLEASGGRSGYTRVP